MTFLVRIQSETNNCEVDDAREQKILELLLRKELGLPTSLKSYENEVRKTNKKVR